MQWCANFASHVRDIWPLQWSVFFYYTPTNTLEPQFYIFYNWHCILCDSYIRALGMCQLSIVHASLFLMFLCALFTDPNSRYRRWKSKATGCSKPCSSFVTNVFFLPGDYLFVCNADHNYCNYGTALRIFKNEGHQFTCTKHSRGFQQFGKCSKVERYAKQGKHRLTKQSTRHGHPRSFFRFSDIFTKHVDRYMKH